MANRTKFKAANSEQAAKLLGSQPAFLSFADASRAFFTSSASNSQDSSTASNQGEPGSSQQQHLSLDIDSDFQTIFRHLSKKDVNTKLKALQDFVDILPKKDAASLDKTFNYWQRIYRKLANATDPKIRHESHQAHKRLIERLDRQQLLWSYAVSPEESGSSTALEDVSFQKLVTLPAILWCACQDQSPQAGESAREIFNFIFPSSEEKLQFLLDNHVTILNYCAYTMFQKIPFDLFYTSPLSKEARKVFDEHLLLTTFLGLSKLVNDLMCSDVKPDQCEQCLGRIFNTVNQEFVKSKQVHAIAKPQELSVNIPAVAGDASGAGAAGGKKKNKKKTGPDQSQDQPEEQKGFKFWTYEKVENYSVRIAFYSFLNSFTRLTSKLLQDTQSSRPDSDGTILWFKLYKTVFLNKVFFSFADTVAQVRGHSWLLATHILLNANEYKPWSVVSQEKWRKDVLIPFVQNGCKPREGVMDFGLINIINKIVYPEFFSKKYPNQSAFKMICDSYSLTNVVENVKLITVFADAYQESCPEKDDVYSVLISAFSGALSKAFLLSDAKFLVEIYFNLIYHFILRNGQHGEVEVLKPKFEQIFVSIKKLILESFTNTQELLPNSYLYPNLLVLVKNVTNDYQQSANITPEVFELFKQNILQLYTSILNYSLASSSSSASDAKTSKNSATSKASSLEFKNFLKCLNFLFFVQHDGYFSCEYYYLRCNTDYVKNFLNLFKSRSSQQALSKEKKVHFQVQIQESPSQHEESGLGHVSLFNPSFSDFKADTRAILPDEFHGLTEKYSVTIARLCKEFRENLLATGASERLMILVYHLQYFVRIFDSVSVELFYRELGVKNSEEFVQEFLLVCIDSLVKSVCSKENTSSVKLEMTIIQKLFDWVILSAPTTKESATSLATILNRMDSFALILFMEHLDKLKEYPFSARYEQKLEFVRENIGQDIYHRSLSAEIEKLAQGAVSKIQLVNLEKLLETFLCHDIAPEKIEEVFHVFFKLIETDSFGQLPSGSNWYYGKLARLFEKILDKVQIMEARDVDRFSTRLVAIVEFLLEKCLTSNCSGDFTSEQFSQVLKFLQRTFKFCDVFGPKLGAVLVQFFAQIVVPSFYHETAPTLGNMDRLEFVQDVVNIGVECFRTLSEPFDIVRTGFVRSLDEHSAGYRRDLTPAIFATEGDDVELKLLAFYELFVTDKQKVLDEPATLEKIDFEAIRSRFKIPYFNNQAIIAKSLLTQLYTDQVEELLEKPEASILEAVKNLFEIYFYFDQSFIMPMSQDFGRVDKTEGHGINIEFGGLNEQLSGLIEAITKSEPDAMMKLFGFLTGIRAKKIDNPLFVFYLNQAFFFLELTDIFEFFGISPDDFSVQILNFLENRDFSVFEKHFDQFQTPQDSPEFKFQELTFREHQKMLFVSYLLLWEGSGDEQSTVKRVKNILSYIQTTKVIDFINLKESEKSVTALFAKIVSKISTNALRQLKDHQFFYEMISCLLAKVMNTIVVTDDRPHQCIDFLMNSRIIKALIDCNQEICKQTSRIPILDWKHFAAEKANFILMDIVYAMIDFKPKNFVHDIFARRIAHVVEWFDSHTLKICDQFDDFPHRRRLELENKLDEFVLPKMEGGDLVKKSVRFMNTDSEYHENILSLFSGLLFHTDLQWSLAAYHVLSKTMQDLHRVMPDTDNSKRAQDDEDSVVPEDEDDYLQPFQVVTETFRKLNAATHVIFDEYDFADEVLLEPKTDLYDYTLAYLLFWKLYIELIDSFKSTTVRSEKIRNSLIAYVVENELHETLFQVLFHLMMNVEENLDPSDDDYVEEFSVENIEETFKRLDTIRTFSAFRSMFKGKHISLLPRVAQIIYYESLKTLPGIVRSWAGKMKKMDRELIDGFTLKYFTGALVTSEYERFYGEKDLGNITVKFNKRDKDIFLVYVLNDICFKIKFSFPFNYPLVPITVECLDHSGVSDDQTKQWLQRLVVFFSKQNCSIKDGIVMLKPNMDKFFENIDECMICLFVFYAATKELPRFRCAQCRKKFHHTCIRRWFHSSGQNTCPLCKFEFYQPRSVGHTLR